MNEDQLHKQTKQPILEATTDNLSKNKKRRLLKGAMAIPVIMTLQSGAALARSSNMTGQVDLTGLNNLQIQNLVSVEGNPVAEVATETNFLDNKEDLICVHPEGGPTTEQPVDLGDFPNYTVDTSRVGGSGRPDYVTQVNNCNGIFVSGAAWNSIGPRVIRI